MKFPYGVGALVPAGLAGDIYRLVRPLGDGASAFVYEAEDVGRGLRVALKLLRDDASPARMRSEWRALQSLSHASIVRVLACGFTRDAHRVPYLAMPLLGGASLRAVLDAEGSLGLERSLDHGIELFGALAHAHRAGLVHRDLRPDNIFLERIAPLVHRLVVLDFGLACAPGVAIPAEGGLDGHAHYTAPELFYGVAPSFATDLYAAGLVLFEMLTGVHALGGGCENWRHMHSSVATPPLEALVPTAPAALIELQASLLAKDARERPPSAEACGKALCAMQEELLVAAPNSTTEDGVDSLLRRLAGPAADEVTQEDSPRPSLLRLASLPDDTDKHQPPSSSNWAISR